MLVLGGGKSGKSAFVRDLAKAYLKVLCLVTMLPDDNSTYFQHIRLRPTSWDVLEEPVELAVCLQQFASDYDLIILDDISLWISNLILLKKNIYYEVDCILKELIKLPAKLIVSRELGLGILPSNLLVLKYVNLLGCVNQLFAFALDTVYFLLAGRALKIK
ncbi:MAG: bifunctional adenosylcobinamide kinase/adenosylcobinamide-phosphate guanylyltransferase [Candidatus Hodgkinia cicadicola]